MADFEPGQVSRLLNHRLTLIVHADALDAAREALRCGFFDARLYWRRSQEQALGMPAVKWALSGEFQGPLGTATRLVQCLALHLTTLPVVLVRLETLGGIASPVRPAFSWRDEPLDSAPAFPFAGPMHDTSASSSSSIQPGARG
ncbi:MULTISPECIES: hypothetical protein [Variovorax]|jgi:hypothetical protein|uniref:hypothetical protein n=1 Tax=Variovorax TaxID=34072 RepID=UPI00086BB4C6|nr:MULTISPECIES: hypothetical protein [Variovorax]MBN8755936.1 hypothetical protein [Variovorax sp.]ODU15144.1 MAG: hypothetical protein ABS94_19960 [Variovorax sp. SCN 67-85]ODV17528.1 MAG: hypothetical protein ABT25_29540 [Variovorax sp. SCN 67-20]OJZ09934.1 MAG: hypothetical protein BGP22_26990 [Variovorax sp. 67-131]UKI06538.1 hypothetical protein L3V85_27520 [Variovorax paradoxus]